MEIIKLKKSDVKCACGCGELPKGEIVNKTNGKYYKKQCGKNYRLVVESCRRIRKWCRDGEL